MQVSPATGLTVRSLLKGLNANQHIGLIVLNVFRVLICPLREFSASLVKRLKSILPDSSHELESEEFSALQDEARSQWVNRLRQRRSRLSGSSDQQTVVEMRQEERF